MSSCGPGNVLSDGVVVLIRVYMGSWNKFSLVAQVFLILELLVLRSSVICIRLYDVVWFMESRFNVSFLRSRLPLKANELQMWRILTGDTVGRLSKRRDVEQIY